MVMIPLCFFFLLFFFLFFLFFFIVARMPALLRFLSLDFSSSTSLY